MKNDFDMDGFARLVSRTITFCLFTLLLIVFVSALVCIDKGNFRSLFLNSDANKQSDTFNGIKNEFWIPPDSNLIHDEKTKALIKYGRQLISRTSFFLGPKGIVRQISNGMNCQNCHLDAGTGIFGNNYSAVASTYPKFRARSGSVESIEKRVNDCFERSLNGSALPESSREMQAIVAYIKFLGTDVPKGISPKGSGLIDIDFIERAADPEKGKIQYAARCAVCHGANGQGIKKESGSEYIYPPLWGENSYNNGAGLYRLSRFASYIKANMPLGTTYDSPQLTDEEAWDIAAYVNSMPRPAKDLSKDWPDVSKKPFDHPFGPFTDGFHENQHKYGPFQHIVDKRNDLMKLKQEAK